MSEKLKENKYENYRQNIVLTMAYLLGVSDSNLNTKYENIKDLEKCLDELFENKDARIIRYLSILRNEFFTRHKKIREHLNNVSSIYDMKDVVSVNLIDELSEFGIDVVKLDKGTSVQIAYINNLISANIEKVKKIFPDWIRWEYVKNLFKMPKCYIESDKSIKGKNIDKLRLEVKKARGFYNEYYDYYPFQVYLSWGHKRPREDWGNVLYNDDKFLKILYSLNNDRFQGSGYVIDAKIDTKENIYNFLKNSEKAIILVDCENMEPFKLLAVLKNLHEEKLKKIQKIFLINDKNTTKTWDFFKDFTNIKVEHILAERVIKEKSLVDQNLILTASKEHYKNNVDSIIIASSDSDYVPLASSLKEANFLFLTEKRLTSEKTTDKYDELEIIYCFVDDFAQDEVQDCKNMVLYNSLMQIIEKINAEGVFPTFNALELVDLVYESVYIKERHNQLEQEKEVFFKNYIKPGFIIKIGDDNKLIVEITSKKRV